MLCRCGDLSVFPIRLCVRYIAFGDIFDRVNRIVGSQMFICCFYSPLRRNNAFGKRVFCSWFHFGIVCFQVWTTGEVAIWSNPPSRLPNICSSTKSERYACKNIHDLSIQYGVARRIAPSFGKFSPLRIVSRSKISSIVYRCQILSFNINNSIYYID